MITAVRHFGYVGIGATLPQLFRADDKKFYVVKCQTNQLGSKVLANEMLASKLGELWGLRFPFGTIIEIKEETILKSRKLQELGIRPGQHFASQYLNHTEYLHGNNLFKAENINEIAGVLLFDHIFHNGDRTNNKKNLLLRKEIGGCHIYAIDNSHLFRSTRWTVEHLNKIAATVRPYCRYSYGLLLKSWLSPVHFHPYIKRVKELSCQTIQEVVAKIPDEWLPDKEERQAVRQYILFRRNRIEEIGEVIFKQIPKGRGGHGRHTAE